MIIRRLNEKGIKEFERFISDLRNGSKRNTPTDLLTSDLESDELGFQLDIDVENFKNRYEMGAYLVDRLNSVDKQAFTNDVGFWSALALFWFDQLCPVKSDGSRKPSMVYNYILSKDYKHKPRHAVFTTWQLVEKYSDQVRFLLSKKLPVRGELTEQIMARQYYFSCEGVIHTASGLYYDTEKETFRKGAAGRGLGSVSRFVNWLQQLEVNYDLFTMAPNDLLQIMPKEFDRFRV